MLDQAETTAVGVTVLPEFFQVEGPEAVIENLVSRSGATAIATSPYVMAPAPEGEGSREPPADGGAGKVRLLDRPLWGRRELWVRTAPSFVPDPDLYRGLRYQPPAADELTELQGSVVAQAIRAAKARGLEVHLQVQAAIPPGYRVQFGGPEAEDRPALPDGSPVASRVDNNGSLASPHLRAYLRALLTDLVRTYPEVDAIRLDWPEYPPYGPDAAFLDFSVHAQAAARRLGHPLEEMRPDALAARRTLRERLTDADLEALLDADGGRFALLDALRKFPSLAVLAAFRTALVTELVSEAAETVRAVSGGAIGLIPQAFPPPLTAVSGFDPGAIGPHVAAIGVKLYTMHWPMMVRAYGAWLTERNPDLAESAALAPALARLLDVVDDEAPSRIADWRYPEPGEPHPVGTRAQGRKIRASRLAARPTPVLAFVHGYGPEDDFVRRLQAGWNASGGRIFVNRYGYLSDRKLDAIGRVVAAAPAGA